MSYCFAADCNHNALRSGCSFYRFPKEKSTFNKWSVACRRADREPTNNDRLCSCHFVDSKKENGPSIFNYNEKKRFMFTSPEKRKRSLSTFQQHQETEEQSTSTSSDCINISDVSSGNEEIITSDKYLETILVVSVDETPTASEASSSNLTADSPPVFDSPISSMNNDKSPSPKRRKLKRISYIGDVSDSDFTSPERAKMAFDIARRVIHQKNKEIKKLQQSKRRLRLRVHNLEYLLEFLKQK